MKAVVFSLTSSLAGLGSGALLGALGSLLPSNVRVGIAMVLAMVAIPLGLVELGGHRLVLLQCNRETPQRWLHRGPLQWAALNGMTLGCGAMSRTGFWLWYVIPTGALLVGRPDLGAVLYGTYGTVRGTAVWGIIFGLVRWCGGGDAAARWLIGRAGVARVVAAGQLALLGAAVAIGVGL